MAVVHAKNELVTASHVSKALSKKMTTAPHAKRAASLAKPSSTTAPHVIMVIFWMWMGPLVPSATSNARHVKGMVLIAPTVELASLMMGLNVRCVIGFAMNVTELRIIVRVVGHRIIIICLRRKILVCRVMVQGICLMVIHALLASRVA
ncbi:MAG: hypothetical protein QF704_09810 [Anaerolineales bacterium]|nr:hypothetical protein [Anaerolineales bacterium]